jgi:hypothetical protein
VQREAARCVRRWSGLEEGGDKAPLQPEGRISVRLLTGEYTLTISSFMIAGMVEIARGDRRGGNSVEKEGSFQQWRRTASENQKRSNKKNEEIWPRWTDREGAGGASTLPAARCGGSKSPFLPRPSHHAVANVGFGKASESPVGKLDGNSLFQAAIARGRLRSSSRGHVRCWMSADCWTFCVEVLILNEFTLATAFLLSRLGLAVTAVR